MNDVIQARVLTAALKASGDVAYRWDLVSDDIEWAGDLYHFLGGGSAELVKTGEHYNGRINDEDLPQRLMTLNQHMVDGQIFECEYRLRRNDGVFAWVHEKASTEYDRDGIPIAMAGLLRNVSGRKQEESLLEHRANFDELTGHLNKSRLREALQSALAYANRFNVSGAFITVGIDKLAQINETYGVPAADSVIIGIGHQVERNVRIVDMIGRLDGDMFGVVLSNCDEKGMLSIAGRILESINETSFDTPAGEVFATVSLGIVIFPEGIHTAHQAMSNAISSLREAKLAGRNCLKVFQLSNDDIDLQARNQSMADKILKALEENRIVLAYQPIVDSHTREVRYYETLSRMFDETGEEVGASSFIPVAESLGIIRQLDRRGLEIAIDDLHNHPDIKLSLNVSGHTITDHSWLRALVNSVKNHPQLARRLMIEITETTALDDFDVAARFVSSVRALGCKVALDDFGSGFTSFKQMKSLTIDVVKIDGIFVRDVERNHDNRMFIKTLMTATKGLGVDTVGECVENEEVARILMEEGVTYLQGWHTGRPTVSPDWRKPR